MNPQPTESRGEPAALAGAPVADGDLCVFRAALDLGAGAPTTVLLASFHGDTNGLASTPVVSAVRALAISETALGRDHPSVAISLVLEMPDSESNRKLGAFMARLAVVEPSARAASSLRATMRRA